MKQTVLAIVAIALLCFRSSVSNAQFCFVQVPDTIALNAIVYTIICDDFNHDGKPDLASNNSSDSLSVSLAMGGGLFLSPVFFPADSGPTWICSADMNGDGDIDLITPNWYSNNVSVLLGNGAGSFGAPVNYPTNIDPHCVCSGDFNGDSNADIAVLTSYSSAQVSVLWGDGTGSFSSTSNFSIGVPGGPYKIISADFNGDGNSDLALSMGSGSNITVFIANGLGGFTRTNYLVSGATSAIFSTDLNEDSIPDIAAAGGGNLVVLLGTGTGSFGSPSYFPIGGTNGGICNADFNTDGKEDLATSQYTMANTVSIYTGTGTGSFDAPVSFPVNTTPAAIATADFDGDSLPDLAVANYGTYDIKILLNCTSVGVMESVKKEDQLYISPNPANDVVNVKIQNVIQGSYYDFQVINALGEEVMQTEKIASDNIGINVGALQNGIYFIRVRSKEEISTQKIVIQH